MEACVPVLTPKSKPLNIFHVGLLICHQMPPKRDEAALQEEEELQLAIALSQSEAEEKERMVSYTAKTFHRTFGFTTYQ